MKNLAISIGLVVAIVLLFMSFQNDFDIPVTETSRETLSAMGADGQKVSGESAAQNEVVEKIPVLSSEQLLATREIVQKADLMKGKDLATKVQLLRSRDLTTVAHELKSLFLESGLHDMGLRERVIWFGLKFNSVELVEMWENILTRKNILSSEENAVWDEREPPTFAVAAQSVEQISALRALGELQHNSKTATNLLLEVATGRRLVPGQDLLLREMAVRMLMRADKSIVYSLSSILKPQDDLQSRLVLLAQENSL